MNEQSEITEPGVGAKMYSAIKLATQLIEQADQNGRREDPGKTVFTKDEISQHINWILEAMLDHYEANGYQVKRTIDKHE